MMKALFAIVVTALSLGCGHTRGPFVQDGIKINPPITQEGDDKETKTSKVTKFNDGGTRWIKIKDAEGRKFDVYIDHRIGTTTPGAIYLMDYPGNSNSVRVADQRDFKQKLGELK
jgi:hypothetical protein